jgi:RHS repeat-associated protein
VGAKPYYYDQRGRLIGVAEGPTVLSQYDYDDNGNRLSHTTPGGTDTGAYDAQDRLLSYGDFTFTYGENGELRTKTDTVTSDVMTYVYDALGSLRSVTLPDTTVIDYVIDGQGRRVGKRVDGALVQGFLYKDQLRIAAELDSAGEVVAQFSYVGGSHSPDWMTKGGALYRFVKDQVSSVRLVVNAVTGDVAQEIEYGEFGVVLSDSNLGFQPFGFAGGVYDGETGLTRFGARDYDASVGRWVSKDPILFDGGQANLYVYVDNDPINRSDETGEGPADCVKPIARYLECKGKLDQRIEENECSPNGPDRGHDKAIEQRRNRCEELKRKAFNQCKDPSTWGPLLIGAGIGIGIGIVTGGAGFGVGAGAAAAAF